MVRFWNQCYACFIQKNLEEVLFFYALKNFQGCQKPLFSFLLLKNDVENYLVNVSGLVVLQRESLLTFSIQSFIIGLFSFSFIVSLENYTTYAIIHSLEIFKCIYVELSVLISFISVVLPLHMPYLVVLLSLSFINQITYLFS